ncbi:hypothetical protein H7849_08050 [Alloacidobacterium dinghuense]|uniref:Uncharacterized protein n=1 Tax=Alloacidobacterium dinghuense TaxID=2763107 RepID=A0A7G8BMT1_9BACT|nr:hypothetical protein [Alloacidobacterium dinghuense]QNI33851.1 hypothetical protein H7849_08050 [Alloacidobacterium dinghuense]
MRLLYVVFVLSILALISTAIAVARHIRRHEAELKTGGEKHPEIVEEPQPVSKSDSE